MCWLGRVEVVLEGRIVRVVVVVGSSSVGVVVVAGLTRKVEIVEHTESDTCSAVEE